VTIIDLRGEINAASDQALNITYSDAVWSNPAAILLNLSDVEYITKVEEIDNENV
jgi:anti-anti-sigma regulatory factor